MAATSLRNAPEPLNSRMGAAWLDFGWPGEWQAVKASIVRAIDAMLANHRSRSSSGWMRSSSRTLRPAARHGSVAQFHRAVRTNTVGKIGAGVVRDEQLELMPASFLIADLLAHHRNRQQAAQVGQFPLMRLIWFCPVLGSVSIAGMDSIPAPRLNDR